MKWSEPPRRRSQPVDDGRVSNLELFFDLVFVFTITQLTNVIAGDPGFRGLVNAAVIFGNVWWMYGGYAWLTNAVPPVTTPLRLFLLAGMAGFFVLALTIPNAFTTGGPAFGVAYLLVTAVHTGMFLRSSHGSIMRSMVRLGPFNGITAVLILAGGFTAGWPRLALWAASFVLHWLSPFLSRVGGFTIRAGHFVERHGLILLIALGESVVAVGLGVKAGAFDERLMLTAGLGLIIAAGLWWLYFDGDDTAAERSLDRGLGERRAWLALNGFGYAFLPILGGIIAFASGVKEALPGGPAAEAQGAAPLLAAGVALYAAGLALFRWYLGIGSPVTRLVLAGLAGLTVFLGWLASLDIQLAVLTALVIGCIVVSRAFEPVETVK